MHRKALEDKPYRLPAALGNRHSVFCTVGPDFLRHRGLKLWSKQDPRRRALVTRRPTTADEVAVWVKEACARENGRDGLYGPHGPSRENGHDRVSMKSIRSIESIYSETAANAALVLIGVACTLLERQITAQAVAFENEGGFTERLYRTRTQKRKQ